MRKAIFSRVNRRLGRAVKDKQLYLSLLAIVVGTVSALGAVVFREAIEFFQMGFFGSPSANLASLVSSLPTWQVVATPVIGGLFVGLLVRYCVSDQRCHGVAEVIEASAIRGGRMKVRDGIASAVISGLSIGSGASVGREGPAVQLGATLASALNGPLKLDRSQSRIMLGSGVAAAIAASFNAPIAGVFFAHEVIIGHYALPAFAPVAIAAITGTVISRIYFGDFPAFIITSHDITSFLELPAFALLGAVCAVVAVCFIRLVPLVQHFYAKLNVPKILMPAIGGLMIGILAIWFPEIMGVGYEATNRALNEEYDLKPLVTLAFIKVTATVICLGSGFGGGVFSPSLFVGAMIGGAFGILAAIPFPELASSLGSYSITGMGAMAAAVLSAPISTTLMIFELTGDYRLTIAVLVAVVCATVITRVTHGPSYFLWMLASRGVDLAGGHDVGMLAQPKLATLIRQDHVTLNQGESLSFLREKLITAPNGEVFVENKGVFVGRLMLSDLGPSAFDDRFDDEKTVGQLVKRTERFVYQHYTLEQVAEVFSRGEDSLLAVLDNAEGQRIMGCVHERDIMRAHISYIQALERLRLEEH